MNHKDEYRIRVLGMLDEKSKGKDIVVDTAPAPKRAQVIDIMEALKRSMERVPAKKRQAVGVAAKKKKECCKLQKARSSLAVSATFSFQT